jgi:hypothetical protein
VGQIVNLRAGCQPALGGLNNPSEDGILPHIATSGKADMFESDSIRGK